VVVVVVVLVSDQINQNRCHGLVGGIEVGRDSGAQSCSSGGGGDGGGTTSTNTSSGGGGGGGGSGSSSSPE